MVLDEVPALEHLPNLPLALVESRKANTRMVRGLQSHRQLEARYGKEAEAMLSLVVARSPDRATPATEGLRSLPALQRSPKLAVGSMTGRRTPGT